MNREGLKVQVPTLVQLERVWVTCPGCGEEVLAVARDGRVRGFCGVARRYVNFLAETQRIGKNPTAETSPVKDGVVSGIVSAYLRGVKTVVIQDRYKISPGRMYRVLRSASVKLRTDREPKQQGAGAKEVN